MGRVDVLKGIVSMYGGMLGMDLKCEYIYICML